MLSALLRSFCVRVRAQLDDKGRTWLARTGFDPVYGARPLKVRMLIKPLVRACTHSF